ncbi:MAG: hypothetical protein AAGD35_22095 [Actinomycetota bacterium]
MTPTQRMIDFIDGPEAEEYAAKETLDMAPLFAAEPTRASVGDYLRHRIEELYQLFDQASTHQLIVTDVPDLDTVDWEAVADHIAPRKKWRDT